MVDDTKVTYYQRNRDQALKKAKEYLLICEQR